MWWFKKNRNVISKAHKKNSTRLLYTLESFFEVIINNLGKRVMVINRDVRNQKIEEIGPQFTEGKPCAIPSRNRV